MENIYDYPFSVDGSILFHARKILQSAAPVISSSMQRPEGSMDNPSKANSSFHSTLATVIPAVLCTLLCILVRYRFCCRRRQAVLEPSIDPGIEGGHNGMNKIDIEALPATVYRTGSPLADMDCPICQAESVGMDCPICLSEFEEGEKLRVLPGCCHSFHMVCIDAWLISNSTCPSCRKSLLDVPLKTSRGVADPAAESSQSAQMRADERNEGVTVTHVVQSLQD